MSTPTTSRSAYPASVDELLPQARELAEALGETPSRNRLMTELRIGARKASTLRTALAGETDQATESGTETSPVRLHLVAEPIEPGEPVPDSPATEPGTGPLPIVATSTPTKTTTEPDPAPEPSPTEHPPGTAGAEDVSEQAAAAANPATDSAAESRPVGRVPAAWPVLLLALPAFVAIWSGWVGLGSLTGFGLVHPLPGIADEFAINTAITLPIGVETYAAYALRVWLSGAVPAQARRFAKWSALGSLALGAAGQVAYHLMTAAEVTAAPWWITTAVSCLPVAVLGMGAALTHLLHTPAVESEAR